LRGTVNGKERGKIFRGGWLSRSYAAIAPRREKKGDIQSILLERIREVRGGKKNTHSSMSSLPLVSRLKKRKKKEGGKKKKPRSDFALCVIPRNS